MSDGSPLATRVLDDEQLAFYRSNGYLVVADVVPDEFLLAAQRLLERIVDDTIAEWCRDELIDDAFETLDFGCRFHRAWLAAGCPPRDAASEDERFRSGVRSELSWQGWMGGLAAEVLGTGRVGTMPSSFFRARFPDDERACLPWHQDIQCLKWIADVAFLTVWIPLVDIGSADACLEVSPVDEEQDELQPVWSKGAQYVRMGDGDIDRLVDPRLVPMRRGDVLLLSPYLPHRSLVNRGSQIRWSIDLRFTPA